MSIYDGINTHEMTNYQFRGFNPQLYPDTDNYVIYLNIKIKDKTNRTAMVNGQLIRQEFHLSRANFHQYRGVARIFQRGGHRGYSPDHHPWIADYIWFIPPLSLVYQQAQSYYRGMKAKKVSFSTMALMPRYCHGVFAT